MSKAQLSVIEGGRERERLSGEILEEICKLEWDQQRISSLMAQLQASPKPTLELVVSNAGRRLGSGRAAKNESREEDSP
ncbi:MAG: hypothetical protein V4650_01850 [Pseudomonadota bacterium]